MMNMKLKQRADKEIVIYFISSCEVLVVEPDEN